MQLDIVQLTVSANATSEGIRESTIIASKDDNKTSER
jgi:hypothetical protein